jgi:hypothetical protein
MTKNTRLYKIETNLTNQQNNELLKNTSDEDQKYLTSLDIKVAVDLVNEQDFIETFMVINEINLEKLKVYFKKQNIKYDIQDITDYFIEDSEIEDISKFLEELTSDDIFKKLGIEI